MTDTANQRLTLLEIVNLPDVKRLRQATLQAHTEWTGTVWPSEKDEQRYGQLFTAYHAYINHLCYVNGLKAHTWTVEGGASVAPGYGPEPPEDIAALLEGL